MLGFRPQGSPQCLALHAYTYVRSRARALSPRLTPSTPLAQFDDAKFGIYAHWGVFSVPAFHTEWYSRNMYVNGTTDNAHHREVYGDPADVGYKDLVADFTADQFNATAWARLYRRAGAQYAGPVAEHADGFAMWRSNVSEWNAAEKGPRRDIVAEVSKAVRAEGLHVVASLHHSWLWGWYPTFNRTLAHDCGDPEFQLTDEHGGLYGSVAPPNAWSINSTQEFQDYWLAKALELTTYEPDL